MRDKEKVIGEYTDADERVWEKREIDIFGEKVIVDVCKITNEIETIPRPFPKCGILKASKRKQVLIVFDDEVLEKYGEKK